MEEVATVAASQPAPSQTFSAPEPVKPHAEIVAALLADLDTAEVTRTLIVPLLEKWPEVRGDAKDVLGGTAEKFRYYPERKLKFAVGHLLKGRHEFFPDAQEIYGAIGRFEGHQARRKDEAKQKELVSNGARL